MLEVAPEFVVGAGPSNSVETRVSYQVMSPPLTGGPNIRGSNDLSMVGGDVLETLIQRDIQRQFSVSGFLVEIRTILS
jgi:hypothetical protein